METELIEIGEQLCRVTRKNKTFLLSGKVVAGSLDEENGYCQVLLTGMMDESGDGSGNDVLLSSVSLNNNGVILYPADGSDVIVGEVDGPGQYVLMRCSNLVKVNVIIGGSSITITDGLIQFNDGSLDGLPILSKIQDNLKAIHDYIFNTLQPAIGNGIAAVGVGSAANGTTGQTAFNTAVAGQDITFEDMENTNIKQG